MDKCTACAECRAAEARRLRRLSNLEQHAAMHLPVVLSRLIGGYAIEPQAPTVQVPETAATWLILGPRNSGKTTMMLDVLRTLTARGLCDLPLCMTATLSSAEAMASVCPPQLVHRNGYDVAAATRLLDLAQRGVSGSSVLVLDDILHDRTLARCETFRELLLKPKTVSVVLTAQYHRALPPGLLPHIDVVIFFMDSNMEIRLSWFKQFFVKWFARFRDFDSWFQAQCTGHKSAQARQGGSESRVRAPR